jgi:Domain of unknown function (DUF4410)
MNSTAKQAAAAVVVCVLAGLSGCATSTNSTKARPLIDAKTTQKTLADCQHTTIAPFAVPSGGKVDNSVGLKFSNDVQVRLRTDYGPIFASVESGAAARGLEGECLVGGKITKYKPGSRVARAILIGLGAASLEGNVTVNDAASGQSLLSAPFDKLWAWGGIAGAAKGIEDMSEEAAASVANTLARAKGWEPPATK